MSWSLQNLYLSPIAGKKHIIQTYLQAREGENPALGKDAERPLCSSLLTTYADDFPLRAP